jgi:hypothetical protein
MFRAATKLAVEAGICTIPRRSKTKFPQMMAAITMLLRRVLPRSSRSLGKKTIPRITAATTDVIVM